MMKTRRFWLVLLLLASATLSAQTIVLDYVDGTVELKTKTNTWVTVDAGAKLNADSVLRLSNNGLAEMTVGTSRLHLGKDGTYPLVNLLAQAGKKTESNLASLAGSKVDKLLSGNPTGQVQVANMGARAAEMDAGSRHSRPVCAGCRFRQRRKRRAVVAHAAEARSAADGPELCGRFVAVRQPGP